MTMRSAGGPPGRIERRAIRHHRQGVGPLGVGRSHRDGRLFVGVLECGDDDALRWRASSDGLLGCDTRDLDRVAARLATLLPVGVGVAIVTAGGQDKKDKN